MTVHRNAMGKPVCDVCRRRLVVDGCPVHRLLMCNPCHGAQRLSYVCPCFTLEQARKMADAPRARRIARELAKALAADAEFADHVAKELERAGLEVTRGRRRA